MLGEALETAGDNSSKNMIARWKVLVGRLMGNAQTPRDLPKAELVDALLFDYPKRLINDHFLQLIRLFPRHLGVSSFPS